MAFPSGAMVTLSDVAAVDVPVLAIGGVTAERVADLTAMEALVDLTDRVEGWAGKADYPADRWKGITKDGKIYGVPLDSLAANFAAKYIPRPPIDAVVKGALGLSPEALGYNATFVYPKHGGIGALSESIHARVERKAERGRQPVAIDLSNRTAKMSDGEVITYHRLISTIPLPDLVMRALAGNAQTVPEEVVRAAARAGRAGCQAFAETRLSRRPTTVRPPRECKRSP